MQLLFFLTAVPSLALETPGATWCLVFQACNTSDICSDYISMADVPLAISRQNGYTGGSKNVSYCLWVNDLIKSVCGCVCARVCVLKFKRLKTCQSSCLHALDGVYSFPLISITRLTPEQTKDTNFLPLCIRHNGVN